jgi:hypothetical protein
MKAPTSSASRGSLLAEIGQIPVMIQGTLTQKPRRRADGSPVVYHQLQQWEEGANRTRHVPEDHVEAIEQGIQGYARAQDLLAQIARADEQAVLHAPASDSKKKPMRP